MSNTNREFECASSSEDSYVQGLTLSRDSHEEKHGGSSPIQVTCGDSVSFSSGGMKLIESYEDESDVEEYATFSEKCTQLESETQSVHKVLHARPAFKQERLLTFVEKGGAAIDYCAENSLQTQSRCTHNLHCDDPLPVDKRNDIRFGFESAISDNQAVWVSSGNSSLVEPKSTLEDSYEVDQLHCVKQSLDSLNLYSDGQLGLESKPDSYFERESLKHLPVYSPHSVVEHQTYTDCCSAKQQHLEYQQMEYTLGQNKIRDTRTQSSNLQHQHSCNKDASSEQQLSLDHLASIVQSECHVSHLCDHRKYSTEESYKVFNEEETRYQHNRLAGQHWDPCVHPSHSSDLKSCYMKNCRRNYQQLECDHQGADYGRCRNEEQLFTKEVKCTSFSQQSHRWKQPPTCTNYDQKQWDLPYSHNQEYIHQQVSHEQVSNDTLQQYEKQPYHASEQLNKQPLTREDDSGYYHHTEPSSKQKPNAVYVCEQMYANEYKHQDQLLPLCSDNVRSASPLPSVYQDMHLQGTTHADHTSTCMRKGAAYNRAELALAKVCIVNEKSTKPVVDPCSTTNTIQGTCRQFVTTQLTCKGKNESTKRIQPYCKPVKRTMEDNQTAAKALAQFKIPKLGHIPRTTASKLQKTANEVQTVDMSCKLSQKDIVFSNHFNSGLGLTNAQAKPAQQEEIGSLISYSAASEKDHCQLFSGSLLPLDDIILQALVSSVEKVLQVADFDTSKKEMPHKQSAPLELMTESNSPSSERNGCANSNCFSSDVSQSDHNTSCSNVMLSPACAVTLHTAQTDCHEHMDGVGSSGDFHLSSLLPDDENLQITRFTDCEVAPDLQLPPEKCLDKGLCQMSSGKIRKYEITLNCGTLNTENPVDSHQRLLHKSYLKRLKGKRSNKMYKTTAAKHCSLRKARRNKSRSLVTDSEETVCGDNPLCSFCQQPENINSLGYLYGPYKLHYNQSEFTVKDRNTTSFMESNLNNQERELWVHEDCAIWAPGVYLAGTKLIGLREAVSDGKSIKCNVCNKPQATLYCRFRGCGAVYHYPCALLVKCVLKDDQFEVSCLEHVQNF